MLYVSSPDRNSTEPQPQLTTPAWPSSVSTPLTFSIFRALLPWSNYISVVNTVVPEFSYNLHAYYETADSFLTLFRCQFWCWCLFFYHSSLIFSILWVFFASILPFHSLIHHALYLGSYKYNLWKYHCISPSSCTTFPLARSNCVRKLDLMGSNSADCPNTIYKFSLLWTEIN